MARRRGGSLLHRPVPVSARNEGAPDKTLTWEETRNGLPADAPYEYGGCEWDTDDIPATAEELARDAEVERLVAAAQAEALRRALAGGMPAFRYGADGRREPVRRPEAAT